MKPMWCWRKVTQLLCGLKPATTAQDFLGLGWEHNSRHKKSLSIQSFGIQSCHWTATKKSGELFSILCNLVLETQGNPEVCNVICLCITSLPFVCKIMHLKRLIFTNCLQISVQDSTKTVGDPPKILSPRLPISRKETSPFNPVNTLQFETVWCKKVFGIWEPAQSVQLKYHIWFATETRHWHQYCFTKEGSSSTQSCWLGLYAKLQPWNDAGLIQLSTRRICQSNVYCISPHNKTRCVPNSCLRFCLWWVVVLSNKNKANFPCQKVKWQQF